MSEKDSLGVIVHKSDHPKFEALSSVWSGLVRSNRGNIHLVGMGDNLFDTGYLSGVKDGGVVTVCGQEAGACLGNHLGGLADNNRVKSGKIKIQVSRGASFGDVDRVVAQIKERNPQAKIEVVD